MSGEAREVVFVDLDGTLILDNSFHLLVREVLRQGSVGDRLAMLLIVAGRFLGPGRGRRAMKARVIRRLVGMQTARRDRAIEGILAGMTRSLSAPVVEIIQVRRDAGALIVLATAAPEAYAAPFAESLKLDAVIATTLDGSGLMNELLGEAKAQACRAWIAAQGWDEPPAITAISDHLDDLPLLASADTAVVQASAEKFAELRLLLDRTDSSVRHVDPVKAETDGAGHWLFLDDVSRGPFDAWEIRTVLSKHRYGLLYVGDGNWRRVGPGDRLEGAALRRTSPALPPASQRIDIALRRRLVRDALGIFH